MWVCEVLKFLTIEGFRNAKVDHNKYIAADLNIDMWMAFINLPLVCDLLISWTGKDGNV